MIYVADLLEIELRDLVQWQVVSSLPYQSRVWLRLLTKSARNSHDTLMGMCARYEPMSHARTCKAARIKVTDAQGTNYKYMYIR
jgi:hypothetical protein